MASGVSVDLDLYLHLETTRRSSQLASGLEHRTSGTLPAYRLLATGCHLSLSCASTTTLPPLTLRELVAESTRGPSVTFDIRGRDEQSIPSDPDPRGVADGREPGGAPAQGDRAR